MTDAKIPPDELVQVAAGVTQRRRLAGLEVTTVPKIRVPVELEVLGAGELAAFMGVKPGTIRQWRFRGKLPAADLEVNGRECWYAETIQEWANA